MVALGALLSGALPLLLLAQVADVGRSDAWRLTLGLAMWAGLRLTSVIATGRPGLFDFFFWLFVYIFMGIAPTVQMRSGLLAPTTAGIDEGLDVPTALLVWLGVICYEVGRSLAVLRENFHDRKMAAGPNPMPAEAVPATAGVNVTAALVLTAAGALAGAYVVSQIGFGALFGSRDEAAAARSGAWPDPAVRTTIHALSIYPMLVGVGALTQFRRLSRTAVAGWVIVPIVVATALLFLVVNPLSSARYSLGTVLFALVVLAGALVTSFRVRVTLLSTIAGFIFLFPLADAFRRPEMNLVRDGFFGEYRGNSDYDAFWQVANSYSYVLDGLVEPGRQALGVVLFWVPRGLWADKPVDTGILLANYRGYSFDNLSAPLWAESLVNGGIPVLVVAFLLVGYLLRRLDTRLSPAFAHGGFWAIVGAIFPVYMTILMRGSLLQATGMVAVTVACLVVARARPGAAPGWKPMQLSPDTPARVQPRSTTY